MRRRHSVLLVLIVSGLITAALWSTRGRVEQIPFELGATELVDVPRQHTTGAAEARPPASPVRVPVAVEPRPASRATPAGPSSTFRVRVVDGDTNAPVTGAAVWYLLGDPATTVRRDPALFQRLTPDPIALFERFGDHVITDREGRASVPHTGWRRRCIAVAGARVGELDPTATAEDEVFTIRLHENRTVRIRVVDDRGLPVIGARVQTLCSTAGSGASVDSFALTHGATRAPDGTIALHNLDRLARRWSATTDGGWQTRVLVEVLGHEDDGVPLSSAHVPLEPLDVRMPSHARVEVVVRDPRGHRTAATGLVELTIDGDSRTTRCPTLCAPLRAGRAEFPFVALHRELRAVVHRGSETCKRIVPGPTRPGEIVTIDVPLAVRSHALTGRAQDRHGRALAELPIRAFVDTLMPGETRSAHGLTDREGRFHLTMLGSRHDVDWRTLRFWVTDRTRRWLGTVPSLHVLPSDQLDAGDIPFRTPPPLTSGRVVDADGAPIGRARGVVESMNVDGSWDVETELRFAADDEGRFQIVGEAPRAALRLRVHAPGFACTEAVRVAAGVEDLVVTMATAGRLRVRVRVDPGVDRDALSVRVVDRNSNDAPADPLPTRRLRGSAPGVSSYEWSDHLPGRYRLEVRSASTAHVVDVAEIIVVPARTTECEFDLRGTPIDSGTDR